MSLTTAKSVDDASELCVWLLPAVAKFSRAHRYTLGERIATEAIELAVNLQQAAFAIERSRNLDAANQNVTKLRILLRIASALHLISVRQLGFVTERLDNVGRQVGAWKRQAPHEAIRQPV